MVTEKHCYTRKFINISVNFSSWVSVIRLSNNPALTMFVISYLYIFLNDNIPTPLLFRMLCLPSSPSVSCAWFFSPFCQKYFLSISMQVIATTETLGVILPKGEVGRGGGGVVWSEPWNEIPITDWNLWFSLSYFRPEQQLDIPAGLRPLRLVHSFYVCPLLTR